MSAPRLVVARAPLRVSFVGGGSDLPPPAGTIGQCGAVVSAAIDKFVWCVSKRRDDGRFYLSWKEKEVVDDPSLFHHEIVRNAFLDLLKDGAYFSGGVELAFLADVPGTGSGLGSSAATAASCLLALDHLAERYDGIHGRRALAERSIAIQPGPVRGKQDEYATVFGGLNAMRFSAEHGEFVPHVFDGEPRKRLEYAVSVDLSPIGEEDPGAAAWLEERFALFRPPEGAARSAAEVLATFKESSYFRTTCMDISGAFVAYFSRREFDGTMDAVCVHSNFKKFHFGAYAGEDFLEAEKAIYKAGARAVKLCGAGSTGHLLVGFEPEHRAQVVAVAEAAWGRELPFKITAEGACVVYREEGKVGMGQSAYELST